MNKQLPNIFINKMLKRKQSYFLALSIDHKFDHSDNVPTSVIQSTKESEKKPSLIPVPTNTFLSLPVQKRAHEKTHDDNMYFPEHIQHHFVKQCKFFLFA